MVTSVKDVQKQTVAAVVKPVNAWRRILAAAGTVVAKPWRRYRAAVFQTYLIIAVGVLVVLSVLAKTAAYFPFDVKITHAVQNIHSSWFDAVMRLITWIGFGPQVEVITIGMILFIYASGLKWETVVSAVSVAGSSALGIGLKYLIGRPRPSSQLVNVLNQLTSFSFPSGHVLYSVTFYGFLLFLSFTLLKPSWWRTGLLAMLGGGILLMGPSRIYVGQHWTSDVLASFLLGSVWLSLTVLVYRWGKKRFFVNQPIAKETPASP